MYFSCLSVNFIYSFRVLLESQVLLVKRDTLVNLDQWVLLEAEDP